MKHLERGFTGRSNIILYIIVALVALAIQATAMIPILAAIYATYSSQLEGVWAFDTMQVLKSIDSNVALLAIMTPVVISLVAILLLIRVIHKRTFAEVVNGTKRIRWNKVSFGFTIWFALMALVSLIQFIVSPSDFTLQFNIKQFIPLVAISLFFIPLQTTFEEVLTRGYLAQGVATLTKSRWLALLIPALFFAALHLGNPEIKEYGLEVMLATYLSMALIWGLTAVLDDGIELAMGMHAANNIFISLFTTQQGAVFETAAVFEVSGPNPYIELMILIITGSISIAIFHKKYNWNFNTLNKKVEKPTDTTTSIS